MTLCIDAQLYIKGIKSRQFARIYVRSINPVGATKIEYTQKYNYVPKAEKDYLFRQLMFITDLKKVSKTPKEKKYLRQKQLDYDKSRERIMKGYDRITKGKRFKQKFQAIGWYCYRCNRFYHDDEIKQYQHQEGLDI